MSPVQNDVASNRRFDSRLTLPSPSKRPKRGFARLGVALVAALIMAQAPSVSAQSNFWLNTGGGSWETSGNWSLGAAPTNTSLLYVATNGSFTINVNNTTANSNPSTMTVSNLYVGSAGGTATLLVDFTNAAQTLRVGATTSQGTLSLGNAAGQVGALTVSNGRVLSSTLVAGAVAGGVGQVNLFGGTNTAFSGVSLGSVSGSTGTMVVAGGTLVSSNLSSTEIGIGVNGVGSMTVSSGGVVRAEAGFFRIGENAGSRGQLTVDGGSVLYAGTAALVIGGGASGSGNGSALVTAGSLTATQATTYIGYSASGQLVVSNQGKASTKALNVGASTVNGTGSVLVANGGVLESAGPITLGFGTSGVGTVTNQNGGTLRFTSADPTITLTRGSFVVTNATIEFANNQAAGVNVLGGITNITVQANSQLNLNNSWNLGGVAAYGVGTGSTFARLGLLNSGYWQSDSLTVGAGGMLSVSNGGTVSATLTNRGAINVLNGPVLFKQAVFLDTGSTFLTQGGTNIFSGNLTVGSGAGLSVDVASQLVTTNLLIGTTGSATGSVLVANGGQMVVINSADSFRVGDVGAGSLTVSNGGAVAVSNSYLRVGYSGLGQLTVSGGSVWAGGTGLMLGINSGSTGNVAVTSGSVTATNGSGYGYVGYNGVGNVMVNTQGVVTVNNLFLGAAANGQGTVSVDNGGQVSVLTSLTAGSASNATGAIVLDHNGVLSLSGGFQLGTAANGVGTALVAGGAVLSAKNLGDVFQIGAGGVGALTVSNGGTVLVSNGYLRVGNTSLGQLTMEGGNVWLGGAGLMVGAFAGGTGNVVVAGGSITATSGGGVGYVGYSGIGNVAVSNQGVVTVNNLALGAGAGGAGSVSIDRGGRMTVGTSGLSAGGGNGATGSVLVANGGVLEVGGGITLGAGTGSWGAITNQNGGILRFTGANAANPVMTLTQGSLVVTNATIEFSNNQVAGVNVLGNITNLTVQADSQLNLNNSWNAAGVGAYRVGTGSTFARLGLVNSGFWQSASLTIGAGGALFVSNSGTVSTTLTNLGAITILNGPVVFKNGGVFLGGGSSYLSQGGNNIFSNGLTIASGASFLADAASQVSVVGTYQNLGSSWFSNLYSVVSGGIYRSSGATNTFAGGLGIASGGRFDVTNGQSVIGGTITNAGTMTVFNAQAIYNGNVVNQGAYVSDPSTNTFNGNFTVGPTATVTAAANDVYAFGGDLTMQSTNRAFNMSTAVAYFGNTNYGITTGTTNHLFDLTGSGAFDKGSNWLNVAQLATNFSIGTLTIASGNRLTLTGGVGTNALYVGVLDLSAWNTNAGTSLTNTLQAALSLDINLYYDRYAPNNAYLQGVQFGLWGGGLLIPIPEPSTAGLILGGALLSAWLLRRKGE